MKPLLIVGLPVLALYFWVDAGNQMKEMREKGVEFCAKSPAQREMILINTWARERHKPGSTWSSFEDFRRTVRNSYGC